MQMCVSLHLCPSCFVFGSFVCLCACIVLFLFVFILFLFLIYLDACLFSNKRQTKSGFQWIGR